ncbi:hypothetical protein FRC07_001803, partial [Ceratobasidium sp. 392]
MPQPSTISNDTLKPDTSSAVSSSQLHECPAPNAATSKASKPVNVFSNDGSFLEQFKRSKQIESEKKQNDESAIKKRAFADRFKSRGKRLPPQEDISTEEDKGSTKAKVECEKELSQYEKEVKQYQGHSLKDDGT